MGSIEAELWNIFTYYTLHGNPKDPSRINGSVLYKFCRDVMVLDPAMTEKPLTQAELHIIFTSELKNQKKTHATEKSDRIDFNEFLSCLMRIATRCYPTSATYEEAMQQLLMDNVLPLASRRIIVDLSSLVHQDPVNALFKYFEEALSDMFKYYATASDQQTKGKCMIKSTSVGSMMSKRSFDDQRELFQEAKERTNLQNTLANQMGYSEFLRFASDFGLTSSMGLTSLDLGDIYLVVIALGKLETIVRKLDFAEFWECLVRCAIIAFKSYDNVTTEDKVKGLFLYMWRHIQTAIQEQVTKGKGSVLNTANSAKGGLIRGSQRLNERFLVMWDRDGHRDYLDPPAPATPSHGSMISKLLQGGGGAEAEGDESAAAAANPSASASAGASPVGTPLKKTATASKRIHQTSSHSSAIAAMTTSLSKPKGGNRGHDDDSHTHRNVKFHIDIDQQLQRDHAGSAHSTDAGGGATFGDDRITASKLKKLLQLRPDITKLLSDCMLESGIN